MRLSLLVSLRKKIAIGMLLAFCGTELSHFFPFVDYYINFDYITEVLCINKDKPQTSCQGTCYLKDQIQETQQKSPKNQNKSVNEWTKTNLLFFEYHTFENKNTLLTNHSKQNITYLFSIQENSETPPIPPPRV
ncbi:MAG: hypothetical protein ACPF80_03965 [Flavobacteriaceae bacterium]